MVDVLDELFFDGKPIVVIKTEQWEKLIAVLKQHRDEILELKAELKLLKKRG